MENNAKNIKEILANDNYIIPRYQRNYAWGKAEISQLIKDINEFFKDSGEQKSYYLGSLVCFKREDGSFELIDGQQRHTTLTLINLVLKNWTAKIENIVSAPNLKFDSRKKIQNYIENLYKIEKSNFLNQVNELNISGTGNFKDAIEIIQEELREKNVQEFAKNFYEKVYLFRVEVPEDTDLNHYFEIMNNRGEQLEKHEIVKALLMGKISDTTEQEKFALIWDACADMNDYVYFNFDTTNRKNNFSNEGELKVSDFKAISISENSNENQELSLVEIIDKHNIPNDFPKEEKFIKDKYKSVIDFPNFLLQVLKIKDDNVSLDDKKLLEQFSKKINNEESRLNPREFIFDLLKYRILFDKYVIKQDLADADESKQNWGLRKLSTDFETTVKTFNKENGEREDDEELVKLQTMLYYSDSTNTYNNWVQEILKNTDFGVKNYTAKVLTIAKDKFTGWNRDEKIVEKSKLTYPNISIFNLYFIDFLLWKLYKTEEVNENLKSLKSKICNLKGQFNNFKFKQLNSKEHLLPQSKATESEKLVLNDLGNLCLISASQNSSANDKHPLYKREQFKNDNSSLKRLIMFETYDGDNWGKDEIEIHEKEISELMKNNNISCS